MRNTRSYDICYAYQNGSCDRGDSCRFSHEFGAIPEGRNVQKPCHAFSQGNCEYGAACKFSHELPGEICPDAMLVPVVDIDNSNPVPTNIDMDNIDIATDTNFVHQ